MKPSKSEIIVAEQRLTANIGSYIRVFEHAPFFTLSSVGAERLKNFASVAVDDESPGSNIKVIPIQELRDLGFDSFTDSRSAYKILGGVCAGHTPHEVKIDMLALVAVIRRSQERSK